MHDWFQKAIELRSKSEALRRGNLRIVYADPLRPVIAFLRETNKELMLVVINRSTDEIDLELPRNALGQQGNPRLKLLLTNDDKIEPEARTKQGVISLELPACSAAVWKVNR
jgi:hypothetical protein